jgi:general secretion pathway protein J
MSRCDHAIRTTKQAGFTLLETLVALAVLGLLMAGLVQGMQVAVTAWTTQTRALGARSDLDATDRTLRTLMARMEAGGITGRPPLFKGTARSVTFTTELPEAADALVIRDADVTLAVDETHALVLLWQPHSPKSAGPPPPKGRAVLLNDVDQLDISYWQNPQAGWQQEWRGVVLPKLIRLRIVFTAASGRHAPDIVVAPMRDRWRL